MASTDLLTLEDLRAFYGRVEALRGLNLRVEEGEIVALLGPNGAGKTTTMKAICRVVRTEGRIRFAGRDLSRATRAVVARSGVGHVPEGRGTFIDLSVTDNLRLALVSRARGMRTDAKADLHAMYGVFPKLYDLRERTAGKLSGGEQQMLAVARAMLARPRLLLVDEPSTGLAPKLVDEMYAQLAELFGNWGTSVLLAEQNVHHALSLADRAYVLAAGSIRLTGPSHDLAENEQVTAAYLGEGALASSTGDRS